MTKMMSISVCGTLEGFDHVLDGSRQEKTVWECVFPPVSRKEVVQFAMKPEDSFPHDLAAAGGVVIRHFRRHDEFFEELDSFPGNDAPSYFVDQMIVVLRAEPFELLVLGELNGNVASHFRLQPEPAFASPLPHDSVA